MLAQTPPVWERFSEQEQPMFRLNVCSDLAQVMEHHAPWQPDGAINYDMSADWSPSVGISRSPHDLSQSWLLSMSMTTSS